jgi:hypothetical protein
MGCMLQVFHVQWNNRLPGGESLEGCLVITELREQLHLSLLGRMVGDRNAEGRSELFHSLSIT